MNLNESYKANIGTITLLHIKLRHFLTSVLTGCDVLSAAQLGFPVSLLFLESSDWKGQNRIYTVFCLQRLQELSSQVLVV